MKNIAPFENQLYGNILHLIQAATTVAGETKYMPQVISQKKDSTFDTGFPEKKDGSITLRRTDESILLQATWIHSKLTLVINFPDCREPKIYDLSRYVPVKS